MRISPVRKRYATGTGRRHQTQMHCMCLASAYGKYKGGEEPRCTYIHEGHRETYDYIFYSHESLVPTRVLSVPNGTDLRDTDPREPKEIDDNEFNKSEPELIIGLPQNVIIIDINNNYLELYSERAPERDLFA